MTTTMELRRSTAAAVIFLLVCLPAFVVGLSPEISERAERPERRFWTAASYPNPQKESDLFFCGLRVPAFVCDPNKNLNPYEANVSDSGIIAVRDALRHIREETRCSCGDNATEEGVGCDQFDVRGYTVAVALADYMGDLPEDEANNEDAVEEHAREFAIRLRERWRFGQCDDDVVIFVSAGDKKVWTAVGKTVDSVLTPEIIESVTKDAEPMFKKEEYTQALLHMIGQYKLALQGKEVTVHKDGPHLPLGLPLWLLIVIAVLIVIVLLVLVGIIIRCCCTSKSTYQMGRQTP